MRCLAIDTALEACSVGIDPGEGGRPVLASETIGRGHAERLMGMIDRAMADAGLVFSDIERIGVTVGPGSFTGLRVGIAAARGLALVIGCETVGIGTLAVLAASARRIAGPGSLLVALDARRGEIYGQLFDAAGKPLSEAEVGPVAAFLPRIAPGMRLAGGGADLVAEALANAGTPIVHRHTAPEIADLLALTRVAPHPSGPPRPLYLRAPDAKPQAAGVARC